MRIRTREITTTNILPSDLEIVKKYENTDECHAMTLHRILRFVEEARF